MIRDFINGLIFMALALLVFIQTDATDGSLLVAGYHGLIIVMLVCLAMGIVNIAMGISQIIWEINNYDDEGEIPVRRSSK